jgi:tetratricopeptide (TPR) repeat protein
MERRSKVKNKTKLLVWMGLILLTGSFLLHTQGCKKRTDQAKKHYEQALEYHKQELPDQAIAELHQAIKLEPKYAEAHYQLGLIFHEKTDHNNAVRELKEAIKINPDYAEAHFRLGVIYQVLRGYSQAVAEFEEVQRINPDFPRIHTAIGNVYYERGLRAWGAAIKLDWNTYLHPDTSKEISYKNKDELEKAIDDYLTIIESDTSNPAALSKLSQAYYLWAHDEYQKAIEVDSMDSVAHLQLGLTYSERGDPSKAMEQQEILKKLDTRAADMLLQVIRHKEQEVSDLRKKGLRK